MASEWLDVQVSSLSHNPVGLARLKDSGRKGALRLILPGLNGYMASLAALVGTDTIQQTTQAAVRHLKEYEATSAVSFASRVYDKRRDLGRSAS